LHCVKLSSGVTLMLVFVNASHTETIYTITTITTVVKNVCNIKLYVELCKFFHVFYKILVSEHPNVCWKKIQNTDPISLNKNRKIKFYYNIT